MRKTLIAGLVVTLIVGPGEAFAAKPWAGPRQETVDLGVTQTGTPSTAIVGETVTFTSVVTNPGPITASNIDFEFTWWGAM
ncbi:MAG TPA: hypothetical protein VND22_04925 [Actinomycetota bacterium]|nr:hypothetical protein [Actinomycetota bacterium]